MAQTLLTIATVGMRGEDSGTIRSAHSPACAATLQRGCMCDSAGPGWNMGKKINK